MNIDEVLPCTIQHIRRHMTTYRVSGFLTDRYRSFIKNKFLGHEDIYISVPLVTFPTRRIVLKLLERRTYGWMQQDDQFYITVPYDDESYADISEEDRQLVEAAWLLAFV